MQIKNVYQGEWNKNFQRETIYCFGKSNPLCIGWHDKKHVELLSTEGLSKLIRYASKQNEEHTMPELVRDYSLYMV